MKILDLVSKYFLAMILIQGSVLAFLDVRSFEKEDLKEVAKKARVVGRGSIIVAIILFLLNKVI